jgi:hypothetical protein
MNGRRPQHRPSHGASPTQSRLDGTDFDIDLDLADLRAERKAGDP